MTSPNGSALHGPIDQRHGHDGPARTSLGVLDGVLDEVVELAHDALFDHPGLARLLQALDGIA